MYRHFRTNRRIGRGSLAYSFRGGSGGFRVKSFDPSNFITAVSASNGEASVYKVIHSFEDFKIAKELKANIFAKGYKVPTPIQDQSIPSIIEGRDLIGIANTGTGKTAAFLIPLINKVLIARQHKILIVAPTRELALQIREELIGFTKNMNIASALCIGGLNIRRQIADLRKRPNFVIGTPGRLLDLVDSRGLYLSDYETVVLDETDRMVDIGFIKDIKYIVSLLPKVRQSLFFSATIDGKVRSILDNFVTDPVVVSVKTREAAENVSQYVIRVTGISSKVEKLHEVLIAPDCKKALIFGRTKHGVQRLSQELLDRGFKADAIHGNKNQSQRVKTLERFKRSEVNILVATDVASRGLDIPNVTHVINYDLPESQDAYIHRIGRTGRADNKGVALTFV